MIHGLYNSNQHFHFQYVKPFGRWCDFTPSRDCLRYQEDFQALFTINGFEIEHNITHPIPF